MINIKKIVFALLFIFVINPVFSKTAVELMNEGRMILYKGNINEGIRLLEEAQRLDKNSLFIKLFLAKGYSWNNEWEKSKALYKEIISNSGPAEQIYWEGKFGIAQITSWEKKYDEAIILYQEIVNSYKKISKNFKLDINMAIADIYSWKLESEKAIELFNNLLQENPDNPVILNRIAKIYLWEGEYQKSREYTAKVLARYEKDPESEERARVLDQIRTFAFNISYDFTYYIPEESSEVKTKAHNTVMGLNWQYSIPFKIFTYVSGVSQNNIEGADDPNSTDYDINVRCGGIYRINPVTFISMAADYTYDAKIFPDFTSEVSLSRKMTQHIDLVGLYKYTYDKQYTLLTEETKQYHMISPGVIFYYSPAIYNKLQFYVESDSKDLLYSVLIQQYLSLDPEDIFQFFVFLSQGRSYSTYTDTTVLRKVTTYSASLSYTHFFNSTWGIELSTGLTTSVNNYSSYHGGMNVIFKW